MARALAYRWRNCRLEEVKDRYQHLNIDGVKASSIAQIDGQGDPANIALALAKGARQRGLWWPRA
ncbi:MAG: hypothetical protein R3D84_03605 [Paracoccaceae bacterium]